VGDQVRNVMKTERYLLVAKRGIAPVDRDAGMWAGVKEENGA
jgi:hypothetical protein